MYRKCYPIIATPLALSSADRAPSSGAWHLFRSFGGDLHMLTRQDDQRVIFAPLCIHSFPLNTPRQPVPEEIISLLPPPEPNACTADKLRFYRQQKGLLQKEVADHVGIHRTTYTRYEDPAQESHPLPIMKKIAELLLYAEKLGAGNRVHFQSQLECLFFFRPITYN